MPFVVMIPSHGLFEAMTSGKGFHERGEMARRAVMWLREIWGFEHRSNWQVQVCSFFPTAAIAPEGECLCSAAFNADDPQGKESLRARAIVWERQEYFRGYFHACTSGTEK